MQVMAALTPGFMVIHANQMEQLRDVLVYWMREHPLGPLEQETILVQSNGMAQWLKHALAADSGLGIAASIQVSLPARFLWQSYRAVLKESEIADNSPLDKGNLIWRLMRLLPTLLEHPRFVPLQRFLAQDLQQRKLYQLCQRIADIFDQYQVYRADWLEDWANGLDRIDSKGEVLQLEAGSAPDDEQTRLQTLAWQAELWRSLLHDIGTAAVDGSRASVHPRFVQALADCTERPAGLPRRVIVFGISSLPAQTLEALAAMARFSQVILCVHNPCQYYWGDIVADKDLLRSSLARHQRRDGMPQELALEDLHQHAHPLLAAWGKQGRDYIALLQEHDNRASYETLFAAHRQQVDLFHEEAADSLLTQLHSDILNLRPLRETTELWPEVNVQQDGSIRFHSAHSPQREVEILHDQLLDCFSKHPDLQPRDVIVMVPDIDRYAPHIQAVFGQFERKDLRHVPFAVSDQGQRGQEPLLIALELLLQLPQLRMTRSHVLTLLDVRALRERFGVREDDLPLLQRWLDGAGVRWGLHAQQRAGFGLPDDLQQNTWSFGLQRMLAGYAMGQSGALGEIEPYPEVAGLEAAALGPLYLLFQALCGLEQELHAEHTPEDWGTLLFRLLDDFFVGSGQEEQLLLDQLQKALDSWLQACADSGFVQTLPLEVVREAWLEALDGGRDSQRFLAGAVNFCTLMPMRSIPFKMVCLLGMNDGDYPRIQPPLDFDLMVGSYRPGDRSRREDDRYLMLEALLAARQLLYISWVGRNVQDNSECTPSVLVAQLRDHLAQGWRSSDGRPLDEALTTEHPLQPFSAAYFSGADAAFYTYAKEWQVLHEPLAANVVDGRLPPVQQDEPLSADALYRFVRRPVQQFFAQRFKVYLQHEVEDTQDDEPFVLDGLENYQLKSELLRVAADGAGDLAASMQAGAARMQRSGELPLLGFGEQLVEQLVEPLVSQLQQYQQRLAALTPDETPVMLEASREGVSLQSWLGGIHREAANKSPAVVPLLVTGMLRDKRKQWRWSALLRPVFNHVLLHAAGVEAVTEMYAEDGWVRLSSLPQEQATTQLNNWLAAWQEGMQQPLPVAFATAMEWLRMEASGKEETQCYDAALAVYEGSYQISGERDREAVLQRQFADFATLHNHGLEQWTQQLYGGLLELNLEFVAYPQKEEIE